MAERTTPERARGRRVLIAGAAVLALTGLLHLTSHFVGQPPPANDDQATLLRLMRTCTLEGGGATFTMWRVLSGFSLFFSAALVFLALLDVVVAGGRSACAPMVRRVAWINAAFLAVAVGVSAACFPPPPTVLLGVALALFVGAGVRSTLGGPVTAADLETV